MDFPGNHPNPSDATGLKYRHQPFRQAITYINIDSYINNRIASNSVIPMTGNNPSSVKQPTDTPTLSKSKGRKGTDRPPPRKCPMQPDMTPGQATSHHAMYWFRKSGVVTPAGGVRLCRIARSFTGGGSRVVTPAGGVRPCRIARSFTGGGSRVVASAGGVRPCRIFTVMTKLFWGVFALARVRPLDGGYILG